MVLGERRPRTIVGATAALSLSVLLGGCTDGSAGTPTPTVSASEAPSVAQSSAAPEPTTAAPSAEVEKPVPPEAMRRDDVAGAEAAAQYFLELYPYVYATGDLTEWDAMSDPACKFCESVAENALQLHASGGYQLSDGYEVTAVDSRSSDDATPYTAVWVDATEGRSTRVTESGEAEEFEGGPVEFDFAMARQGEEWTVRGVEVRHAEAEGA
ncbi:DUF6318 family protein [Georgenia muralis]|uniref:DUF6318 domain-containing protein n=1 Tax=Georgenia muralis TaxID=154117 RepID=A0A3N4ZJ64_9MICO|nr:DUF6318 family protein [Georgenia muralis]RPF25622.1 hypothetical protein EDD32_0023 [Georgenia muralis]